MTAKPGSPVRRRKPNPIAHRNIFKPRRADAAFCSNACKQATHRAKKRPSLSVAQNAFPTDLEHAELATAAWISELNRYAIPLGVIFTHTRRTFDAAMDIVPGSGAADWVTKYDQGPVGRFLRLLSDYGWFSSSPVVREALTEHIHRRRNLTILSDTKAVLGRDNEDWRRMSDLKRLQASILNGDAVLDLLIRPKPEHRDISIGAPSIMPMPASDGGPRIAKAAPVPSDKPRKTSKRWRHG